MTTVDLPLSAGRTRMSSSFASSLTAFISQDRKFLGGNLARLRAPITLMWALVARFSLALDCVIAVSTVATMWALGTHVGGGGGSLDLLTRQTLGDQ